MDLIAIGQGLGAVKGMTDLVKAMVGLRDAAQFLEKTVELNQKILAVQMALSDAQSEQSTLVETIRGLEKKIAEFETWETEKKRYELKPLGWGAFAYMLKPDARGSEPAHWACQNCYSDRRIKVVQYTMTGYGLRYICPSCKNELNPSPQSLDGNNAKWLD